MRTVAEYRQYAHECREMADPKDRKALELQASAWNKVAAGREAVLKKKEPPEFV
jgi:hypothetical protein